MANLAETATYDAGVYQLETTDPVQGGATGVSNSPLKNLANRTAYLKQHVDGIESGATDLPGYAKLANPAFTGSPTVPTQALGDNSTKIANTAFVQATIGGRLSKSVAGSANVTLTAVEAGNAILELTGALTGNIAVIVPTSPTRSWIVKNATSGAYTITVKTAAGTGAVCTQGKNSVVWTDGTNVYDVLADFDSPALTGTPTAPTAAPGTNTTQLSTTAFVQAALAALVDSSPGTLDTLNELAAALGDDPNFATTIATTLAGKQPLDTDLSAIAALVSVADKMPYATGAGTWALATLSAFARTLLDDADAAAARATLGVGINIPGIAVSLSGLTAYDFTGIPATAKKISLLFNGVSLNGSASLLVQAGAGSIETTGYAGVSGAFQSAAGFPVFSANAANLVYGRLDIDLLSGTTAYTSTHSLGILVGGSSSSASGGGSRGFTGAIDRVRFTTTNGTDQFDAGTVNISWEN